MLSRSWPLRLSRFVNGCPQNAFDELLQGLLLLCSPGLALPIQISGEVPYVQSLVSFFRHYVSQKLTAQCYIRML
jgi:hypothetical protein